MKIRSLDNVNIDKSTGNMTKEEQKQFPTLKEIDNKALKDGMRLKPVKDALELSARGGGLGNIQLSDVLLRLAVQPETIQALGFAASYSRQQKIVEVAEALVKQGVPPTGIIIQPDGMTMCVHMAHANITLKQIVNKANRLTPAQYYVAVALDGNTRFANLYLPPEDSAALLLWADRMYIPFLKLAEDKVLSKQRGQALADLNFATLHALIAEAMEGSGCVYEIIRQAYRVRLDVTLGPRNIFTVYISYSKGPDLVSHLPETISRLKEMLETFGPLTYLRNP